MWSSWVEALPSNSESTAHPPAPSSSCSSTLEPDRELTMMNPATSTTSTPAAIRRMRTARASFSCRLRCAAGRLVVAGRLPAPPRPPPAGLRAGGGRFVFFLAATPRSAGEQLGDAGDALDEVVVAEGVRQPRVPGRAEGLAGHH